MSLYVMHRIINNVPKNAKSWTTFNTSLFCLKIQLEIYKKFICKFTNPLFTKLIQYRIMSNIPENSKSRSIIIPSE